MPRMNSPQSSDSVPRVHHETVNATARHVVVLPMGANVMPSLLAVIEREGIRSGTIQGIGAFQHVEIGFFDVIEKTYHRKTIEHSVEVVSFLGNITRVNNAPFIHAHIALGDQDFSIIGGHFFDATVSVSAEFVIDELPIALHRKHDPISTLNLIVPPED